MICLALGLGFLGFAAMRHARRCPAGHAGWHGWHHHHHASGHHRRRRHRWMVHAGLARLDASPAQERAIIAELERFEDRVHTARRGMHDVRADLGAALRGPVLDDAALGAVLGRVDVTTAELRAAAVDAVRGIHGVLDDRQRADLAALLDAGGGWGRGGSWWRGGPYR